MNPVSVSAETHRQFRSKPKLAAAQPTENETRPKLNFLPISAPKPKFGRPLVVCRHQQICHWTPLHSVTNGGHVRTLLCYGADDVVFGR